MKKTLEIFTASSNYPSARVIIDEEKSIHLHSTVHPEYESKYFSNIAFWGDTIVFVGIGVGYHLIDAIKKLTSNKSIIIIENFKELAINAEQEFFCNQKEKPQNILPETSKDSLSKIVENVTGKIQFIKHPASYSINPVFFDTIIENLSKKNSSQNNNISAKTKKILLLKHSFFLESEIARAFDNQSDIEVIEFNYGDNSNSYQYEEKLQKTIILNNPDLIVSVNMKGFDGDGALASISNRFGIAVAVWFVDDPHPILLHQSQFIKSNFHAFCWEHSYLDFLKKHNFASVNYLPLATDLSIFQNRKNKATINVGFVGSSMGNMFLNSIKSKFLWQENLNKLSEISSNTLLENPQFDVYEIIEKIAKQMNTPLPFQDRRNITWLCSYIIHLTSMKKRVKTIQSLNNKNVEIFGDPTGWQKLLNSNFILHENIDYNNKLCQTYQSIAINLNITSSQMKTALNQRVFDIPASGSFLITDYQKDLDELFEIDKDIITYRNIEELNDKVNFYTKNLKTREEIVTSAIDTIKSRHTYSHRVSKILETIF